MAIFDLYSKRQKRLNGEMPDIYTYDEIPEKLRIQIVHIISESIGDSTSRVYDYPTEAYESIHRTLCKEYGVLKLPTQFQVDTTKNRVLRFIQDVKTVDKVLDVIEVAFWYNKENIAPYYSDYKSKLNVKLSLEEAIEELNERFKENGVGYSYESGQIIRIDSTYVHAEITKPTLSLLSNKKFKGANEEYLNAHEHYRHGRNKECLTECLKSFESTLKTIADEKGWSYNKSDTSKKLIQVCFDNELIPKYHQNQFTSFQSLMESGISTIRNKVAAHGQGNVQQGADDELTRYGLNITGSNIIYLIEMSGIK